MENWNKNEDGKNLMALRETQCERMDEMGFKNWVL
jgi:hypothetical protein